MFPLFQSWTLSFWVCYSYFRISADGNCGKLGGMGSKSKKEILIILSSVSLRIGDYFGYSYLRVLTGSDSAALTAWKATVSRAIASATAPARTKNPNWAFRLMR